MKKIAKSKGVMVSSMISLFLSLLVLATVSMAWLSMNKETNSNGMQLQVEASPNLIISNSTTEIVKASIDSINSNSPFTITHASNDNAYKPATHDSTYATYASGLKYVTNTSDVNASTGTVATPNWGVVPNVNPSTNPSSQSYYIDYIVYVASYAKSMDGVKLKAKIVSAQKGGVDVTTGSLMATSIDVYVGTTISLAYYRGTLNVATKDTHSVYLFDTSNHGSTSATGDIPLNTTPSYLTYTLRCYFDGALESSVGQTYIYTSNLDTSKITLGVQFYIED